MPSRKSESAHPPSVVTAEELEEIIRRLGDAAVDDPPAVDALRLVEHIHVLREALDQALKGVEIAWDTHPRIHDADILDARVEALREAAQLIRDGAGADRLEEIASAAEAEWASFEEVAAELGIDLDELRREDRE